MAPRPHWLFGDQLGPHFLRSRHDGPDADAPVVMIEARSVLRRRRFHRAKAHLVLSAMRHRAAELGDRVQYVRAETYAEGLDRALGRGRPSRSAPGGGGPKGGDTGSGGGTGTGTRAGSRLTVCRPTSRRALEFVAALDGVDVLPAKGFLVPRDDFEQWAAGQGDGEHLRMESFYRWVRRQHQLLMDGDEPAGGRWNLDHDNREPPPRGKTALDVAAPWQPSEDAIDDEVRHDLDRWERAGEVSFVGRDGPRRFPATRREALAALRNFVTHRLPEFGPYEDAMLAADPVMSHSQLSAPLNLGLLHPAECVQRAEKAWRAGDAPLNSVEGFVRQVAGWREYVWQLYWHFGEDYRRRNTLGHTEPLPGWFLDLDAEAVTANCLSTVLAQVRDTGWVHHIPRLMVLGSRALQDGWDPAAVTDWFHRCFVDGYDWVMLPNVLGMSQYADGGLMTTKPYTSGGAYINKMSDLCGPCAYRPTERVGEHACPYTAGYWSFLHRHRARLAANPRTAQAVRGLDRLADLPELLAQAPHRKDTAP
ncbi:deoxyribodipyrimidine photolyase-related protein [Streptomyces sp. DvalAA-14]|uniref:cryptochrome/photolyase family protein n=1 Tax=unclassified Streptomyces TaxID=2593676 RepID=UPI00081B0FA8|nr:MULTISPECIES: cryptochrome/photolyase family protein [unclassified Streptomyces]MYS23424.1 cryptochrome/photolyase family protein [Streptomyces sp. SID4948]SCE32942.1 deoxyribodipyrimidine photolyase-related protein [Streptomyces sp. DvalAA-14]